MGPVGHAPDGSWRQAIRVVAMRPRWGFVSGLRRHKLTAVFGFLIERRVRAIFDGLSHGDYNVAINGLAGDVHHVFAGDHPLAGERHSRDAVRRWFERLFRLFELRFEVRDIIVSGPVWNSVVAVEWIAHVTPNAGAPYENHGAHIIRIRRGRVVYLHAYEDTQKVAEACRVMATAGIAEAGGRADHRLIALASRLSPQQNQRACCRFEGWEVRMVESADRKREVAAACPRSAWAVWRSASRR